MKNYLIGFLVIAACSSSCIGDDFIDDAVDPEIRITTLIDTIAFGTSFQFEFSYLNEVGKEEPVSALWTSSSPEIISINETGLAEALQEGSSDIRVEFQGDGFIVEDQLEVIVGARTVSSSLERMGTIRTTSSYVLEGDFVVKPDSNNLIIEIGDNYRASTSLPGLYIYLTNNPNTTNGALEIGAVQVFSGSHSYIVSEVALNDYSYLLYFCKPFNVKVGDGKIE